VLPLDVADDGTMIDNPQPIWLPLLLFAFPGIVSAAYALNEALFPRDNRPLCTISAVVLVLALLPTHVLALVFGSLSVGLAVAWSIVGGAGYVLTFRRHWDFRLAIARDHPDWARRLGVAALSTLPIVLPTILLNFHDEAYFNQHHAIIAHLQNGTYPPRYLYEPSLPLRYHYGFDLAGAIVTGLLRVRLDHAIDLLTVALWPSMFLLLWRLGEHFGAKRAGLLVAVAVCFSGGWPMLARNLPHCGLCTVNGLEINPPFISYFFQHPWSIGVPLFCLVVLQRAALPLIRNQALGLTALVCSLLLLSLCQTVLFVTTVSAMALAETWNIVRLRDRGAVLVLVGLGLSLLGAQLMGGFFATGPFPPAGGLFNTGFSVHDFSGLDAVVGQIQWNLASFGALLPLGIVGLLRARGKIFLISLAATGLVIANTFRYEYTWDIVKFGTVGAIALSIGAGIALSGLAVWADTRPRRLVCGLVVIALMAEGIASPLDALLAYDPRVRPRLSIQMIRPYFSTSYPVDQDNARAISFLRTHIRVPDVVYRAEDRSEPYAIWGGLSTQFSVFRADTDDNDHYGLGREKFAIRANLGKVSETWFDQLAAEHVSWVVTDPDDAAINAILRSPEGRSRALLAAQYGTVKIFSLR
jgi:hypothetical protein